MADYDFNAQRLFVDVDLSDGQCLNCSPEHANYLVNVLRLRQGDKIFVFNGRDGEWLAELNFGGKRDCRLRVLEKTRPQSDGQDIDYLFAPLKRARQDYMVQKATELGVARIRPVITRRTQSRRVNMERLRANVIEAAEQCGILQIPEVEEVTNLPSVLERWPEGRRLVFCDEAADCASAIDALAGLCEESITVLIGPEGGFDPSEREMLKAQPFVTAIWLGPRIMRADTAAVAALTLVNSVLGDWKSK